MGRRASTPGPARTVNLPLRRRLLYPVELRGRERRHDSMTTEVTQPRPARGGRGSPPNRAPREAAGRRSPRRPNLPTRATSYREALHTPWVRRAGRDKRRFLSPDPYGPSQLESTLFAPRL